MSLFTGYLLFFIPSAFLGAIFLRFFALMFIYDNMAVIWSGIIPTIAVTGLLVLVSCFFVYRVTLPFGQIVNRIKSGGEKPSDEEKKRCLKIYNTIIVITITVFFTGFVVGQIAVCIIEAINNVTPLETIPFISVVSQSVGVGGIFALITIYGFEVFFFVPARKLLNLQTIKGFEKYKRLNVTHSLQLVVIISMYFIAINLAFVPLGLISKPSYLAKPNLVSYVVTSLICIFLGSLAIVSVPFFTVLKGLNQRIKDTTVLVSDIAEKGDLTSRITITSIDDFGGLVGSINTLMDQLSTMVVSFKNGTGVLENSANLLTNVSANAITAVGKLNNAFEDIETEVNAQNQFIKEADTNVDSLIEKIDTIQQYVNNQNLAVQQSSAAVSEMTANIASVADLTKKADTVSAKLASSSEVGNASIGNAVTAITQIQQSSAEVQNFVRVIQKISSQTNLLAMNAAIEAAHAGEVGKGFAVVADEVRSLAASSAKSAKDIQVHISDMVEKINSGVEAINSAGGAFKEITEQVQQNYSLTRTIAGAMEEQRVGAEETLKTTADVVESIQAIKKLTEEETSKAENVRNAMKKVVDAARQTTQVIGDSSIVSADLQQALYQVDSTTSENQESVSAMKKNVENFDV